VVKVAFFSFIASIMNCGGYGRNLWSSLSFSSKTAQSPGGRKSKKENEKLILNGNRNCRLDLE